MKSIKKICHRLTISHLDSGLLDGGFLLVLGGADSLLPLGFSHFRLLVPLRHDVLNICFCKVVF